MEIRFSFVKRKGDTLDAFSRASERRIGMKELKIYLEIMGLAEDENGNPDAAVLSIGGGMVPEEEYEERIEDIRQKVTIKDVLRIAGLEGNVEEKDCRFISQEEYEEKYGEDA